MLATPETATATDTTLATAPMPPADGQPEFLALSACDLAEAKAFDLGYATPNAPVLVAFGGGRLHSYKMEGSWDLERAAREQGDALFRSVRRMSAQDSMGEWGDLTFRFGARSFLYAGAEQIVSFASTPAEAKDLAIRFRKAYGKPAAPADGTFHLIEEARYGITCQAVSLPQGTLLKPEVLALHYGTGGAEWHDEFARQLQGTHRGLAILEGPPGTGKTFYLRHLISVLRQSHRFYFIPTASMPVLSKPEFVGFWAGQRRRFSNWQFTVILEDADTALMTRGADNREQVSAILNLSDGLLGDFLRLQIICSINCSAADIDPALLRPGRLLCHRVFGKLPLAQAARLAEKLGRKLPVADDYSLAEVFANRSVEAGSRPRIGFAPQAG